MTDKNYKLPWPDPKVFEAFLREKSPDGKKIPDALILKEETYRELRFGTTSLMWRGLVEERPTKQGPKNYIMGLRIIVRDAVPLNTLQVIWEKVGGSDQSKVANYTWDSPTRTILCELGSHLANMIMQATIDEKDALQRMAEIPSSDAFFTNWFEAVRQQALLKQRLLTVVRLNTKYQEKTTTDPTEPEPDPEDSKVVTPQPPPVVRLN